MSPLSFVLAVSASSLLYVGPGGCDGDDPTCHEPSNKTKMQIISVFDVSGDGKLALKNEFNLGSQSPWLKFHPSGKLFASTDSGVAALNADGGKLSISSQLQIRGDGSVHFSFDRTGKILLSASYYAGLVASATIKSNGDLGQVVSVLEHFGHSVNPDRQEAAHPHAIEVYPFAGEAKQWVYVPDLGNDRIYHYVLDLASGKLANNTPPFITTPPGTGPRHMVFTEGYAYVLLELSSELAEYSVNEATGVLTMASRTSCLPAGFSGFSKAAELSLYKSHEGTRFIFASNRGPNTNSIVRFELVDGGGVKMTGSYSSGGSFPRGFGIHNHMLFSLGQDSMNVAVYSLKNGTPSLLSNYSGVITPVTLDFS